MALRDRDIYLKKDLKYRSFFIFYIDLNYKLWYILYILNLGDDFVATELNRLQKNNLIKEELFKELDKLKQEPDKKPIKITDEYLQILEEEMQNKEDFIY